MVTYNQYFPLIDLSCFDKERELSCKWSFRLLDGTELKSTYHIWTLPVLCSDLVESAASRSERLTWPRSNQGRNKIVLAPEDIVKTRKAAPTKAETIKDQELGGKSAEVQKTAKKTSEIGRAHV